MVEVYHEPLARRYYASRFSCAYFFFLLVGLVAIVVPFFLAYTNVPSFWLKTNTYREQPKVAFQYKVLGNLQGVDADGRNFQIVFSSMADVENLYSGELRVPTLRSIELDLNRDGMADQFHLTALIPLRKGERVLHADLVTFYDVKLRRRARVHMDALAYSSGGGGGMAGKALYVDGDVGLRQRWPFRAKGGYYLPYTKYPLLDPADHELTLEETLMPNIFYGYRNRNNTMDYHELYKVWSPAPPPIDGPFGVREEFNFTMVMRIPEMEILYTPTASEVLKDAWIKYLALFVVVKYLLEKLCAFVFYNQLVDTTMRVETAQHRSGVKATSL
jgi:transmembrane protein 231